MFNQFILSVSQHWNDATISMAIFVFVAYFAIDAMWVYYTLAITERKPFQAANISFVMHFFLAVGVLSYTHNPFYIVPLASGSWAGTFWFARRGLQKEKLDVGRCKPCCSGVELMNEDKQTTNSR